MSIESQIEAILFYKNEPVGIGELCSALGEEKEVVVEAISGLEKNLEGRGLSLVRNGENIALATSASAAGVLEKMAREELSKEIGKAGLETLSIILYKGEAVRKEIDYIRGVNSTFILRSLLLRGLLEKAADRKDARVFVYKPTLALLAHLGLQKIEELPEYSKMRQEIEDTGHDLE